MKFGDSTTHKPRAIDPQQFRAQATGVGQTRGASLLTGKDRAMEVVEHMPPAQRRAVPAAEGYPSTGRNGETYEGMAEYQALGDESDVSTTLLATQRSTLR